MLKKSGFNFEIRTKEVEEVYPSDLPVNEVATYLAELKAEACLDLINADEILLTADSTVVLKNQIFNKPKDFSDAFRMLRALSGRSHKVFTGVCLLSADKMVLRTGVSKVYFDELSDEEIKYYIEKYEPYDKAGAYAIQEWIGQCKIRKIKGTYNNIMGLPVALVYEELQNW